MSLPIAILEFDWTAEVAIDSAKLFAVGGVYDGAAYSTSNVTEIVDDGESTGRYRAQFSDLPFGNYHLIAFAEGVGLKSERYTVFDNGGSVFTPWSEAKPLTTVEIAGAVSDPEGDLSTQIESLAEEVGSRRVVVPVSAIPAQIVRRVDSKLLMRRWASFPYVVENVGDLAGVEKVVFTIKSDRDSDSDAQSLVQVVLSIPADPGDGIKYINGSVATEGQVPLGSIVVEDYVESDEDRKRIVVEITSSGTALIPVKSTAYWDIKLVYEDDSEVLDEGVIEIRTSVGRV